MKKQLKADPLTGMIQNYHTDGEKMVIESIQDCDPILEMIKRRAEFEPDVRGLRYVGTIPDSIAMQWAKESNTKPYTQEWDEYAKKQLNSRDYRKLNPKKICI